MESMENFLKPQFIWLIIGLLLLVMELFVPGLIIIFFGMGACLVGALCLVTDIGLNTQLVIFIVSSLLMLLVLRKSLRSIFMGFSKNKANLAVEPQELLGERAVVVADIAPNLPGKVELHGCNWQAAADEALAPGTPVQIVGKDNLTLTVKRL